MPNPPPLKGALGEGGSDGTKKAASPTLTVPSPPETGLTPTALGTTPAALLRGGRIQPIKSITLQDWTPPSSLFSAFIANAILSPNDSGALGVRIAQQPMTVTHRGVPPSSMQHQHQQQQRRLHHKVCPNATPPPPIHLLSFYAQTPPPPSRPPFVCRTVEFGNSTPILCDLKCSV